MARNRSTPLERVDEILAEYGELADRAEQIIEAHVATVAARTPGVPKKTIRTCEIDGRAHGYSHVAALRQLRRRLVGQGGA